MPMNLNSKKIITSAMLTLIGASMVGSVAGTVAWYQYSTRASAAYVGASAKCTEKLEIQVGDGTGTNWDTELSSAEILDYLDSATTHALTDAGKVTPVTTGNLAYNDPLPTALKSNPRYTYGAFSEWQNATVNKDYVRFPLSFRVQDIDGGSTATYIDEDLYLQDLLIQKDDSNPSGKSDISDAIRVHFASDETTPNYFLFSKAGGDTVTHGNLDLNGDGSADAESGRGTTYSFETLTAIDYGAQTGVTDPKQTALAAYKVDDLNDDSSNTAKKLGTIKSDNVLTITVTIWLEGWQKFGASNSESAVWDPAKYVGCLFDVGMTFGVKTA